MKKRSRFISFIMALILLIPVSVHSEAAEARSSAYIAGYHTCITRTTGFSFEIWFDVEGTQGIMDEIGVYYIQLQKSKDQETWSAVKIFYPSEFPQLMDYNSGSHTACVTYTGENGYFYRANVGFYASKDGGSDRIVSFSSPVYIANGNGGRMGE